jgi:Rha family phage regulatory protein
MRRKHVTTACCSEGERRYNITSWTAPYYAKHLASEALVLKHLIEGDSDTADPLFSRFYDYEECLKAFKNFEYSKNGRREDANREVNRDMQAMLHPPRPPRAPELGPKPRLILREGGYWVSSFVVAEHFEKQHGHVLRDIRQLISHIEETEGKGASLSDFGVVKETMTYRSAEGVMVEKETSRIGHYLMSRDGFALLAMGFTGKKALIWKRRFLNLFKTYEQALFNPPKPLAPPLLTLSLDDLPARLHESFRSENFLLAYHALDRKLAPTVLVWILVKKFGAIEFPPPGRRGYYQNYPHRELVSVRAIVAASQGMLSSRSVYRSRRYLVELGLLKIVKTARRKRMKCWELWELHWQPLMSRFAATAEKTCIRLAPADNQIPALPAPSADQDITLSMEMNHA